MYRLALLLGLLYGWGTGGSLRNLGHHRLRSLWAVFLSAGIQLALPFSERLGALASFAPLFHVLSYIPFFWAIWTNWHYMGIRFVGFGSLLNFIAIVANGGRMPGDRAVLLHQGEPDVLEIMAADASYTHQFATDQTRLPLLIDRFYFPDLYVFPHMVFSIGDAIMALGVALLIAAIMRSKPVLPGETGA